MCNTFPERRGSRPAPRRQVHVCIALRRWYRFDLCPALSLEAGWFEVFMSRYCISTSRFLKLTLAFCVATAAWAGTFGKVVSVGGHASDLALDEARGVLYVANFTANRIEVMSLADHSIQRSMNVAVATRRARLVARWQISGHHPLRQLPGAGLTEQCSDGHRPDDEFPADLRHGQPALGVAFGIDGLALHSHYDRVHSVRSGSGSMQAARYGERFDGERLCRPKPAPCPHRSLRLQWPCPPTA